MLTEKTHMTKEAIKSVFDELRSGGLRYEEIAVMLGVSLDTIRRWIYRGHAPKPYQERRIREIAKKFKISLN